MEKNRYPSRDFKVQSVGGSIPPLLFLLTGEVKLIPRLLFGLGLFIVVFVLSGLLVITLIAPYWPILLALGMGVAAVYIVWTFWPLLLLVFGVFLVWQLFSGQSD